MITCPLCGKEVLDPVDQKPVEDNHANNYYCPDYVEIQRPTTEDPVGKRICHFSRHQLKYLIAGATAYSYQAIIPPYQIAWTSNRAVQVFKLHNNGDRTGDSIYTSKVKDYKTFLKTIERFKKLVPFS